MYALRKIGFYISLFTLVGGGIAVIIMLLLGVGMAGSDDVAGAIIGTIFLVIAVIALIGVAFIVFLMIFYQKSIVVPLLFLVIFGSITLGIASQETPLVYITAGLSVGPAVTIIGYFFKEKEKELPSPEQTN